ncbi:MAG TPA: 50S ribosomal protein L11 methyltransferase [Microthrixaceae bacterium]|nr:50S ribosomal protein L11 methyltransferase [Microthrixaceae bacterium]
MSVDEPRGATDRVAYEVEVDPGMVDWASDVLWSAGASAVAELAADDGVRVRLVADLDPGAVSDLPFEVVRPTTADLAEEDALDAWRAHAMVWRAGDHVVVRPPWLDADLGPGDVVVVVDPGHSFGSGSHPTTRLCLAEVERLVARGDRAIDLGCGSGVLGTAALMLGAASLVAVDLDPAAVAATQEVLRANHLTSRASVLLAALSSTQLATVLAAEGPFDLVVANLLLPVLVGHASVIASMVAPDGHLIVSGVLESQRATAEVALVGARPGLDRSRIARIDDWVAMAFTYHGPP